MNNSGLSVSGEGAPISSILDYIIGRFENTNPEFADYAKKLIGQGIVEPGIIILKEKEKIKTPCVNCDKHIYVQETFLSYLWIVCYSILVIYEEAVAKYYENVQKGASHIIDKELIYNCEEFLQYAISLKAYYSEWDTKKYPTPDKGNGTDIDYHIKATQLFLYAMNYILCHEFAHLEKGHLKKSKSIDLEIEADERAFEHVLKGQTPENRMSLQMGVLIGLCSMLFLSCSVSAGNTHPDTHKRIKSFLEKVNPRDDSQLWSVACLCLGIWDMKFDKYNDFPDKVETHKEMFYMVLEEIEKNK